MELIFTNSVGSIRMDGGGDAPFKIKAVEGLGYITQTAVTAEYPFRSGQRTLQRSPTARLITVSIDAARSGERQEGFLAAVAHDSGRLTVSDGARQVYADCYVSSFSAASVYKGDYSRYALQFTCDYPYFRDVTPTLSPLFERAKLIKGTFTLPKVFSSRVVGSDIFVSGDREVYPVITVGQLSGGEDFALAIKNESTGSELRLNLPSGKYGLLTLDLREGSITCEGEDFTRYLDDDSYMSDFYLRRGENKIRVTAAGIDVGTAASVSFENEYISAWGN